jgi:hypothetical protein
MNAVGVSSEPPLLVVVEIQKLCRLNLPGARRKHGKPARLKGLKPRSELNGRAKNPKPTEPPSGSVSNKQ